MGEKAGVEDIRNTATAHFYVGKRSANTTQKFASYIRAADLFNDLSLRLKGQSSKSEIDRVKLIHTYIAQNTTDLEVKIKSLEHVQALRDQHEIFFDTQAYSFDL